jgi:hypothetical protein
MSLIFFIASIAVVAAIAILVFVKSPSAYFRTKEGKGVLSGILVATLGVAGIALVAGLAFKPASAEALEFFSTAEVYLGLDRTYKISPQCHQGENSDRLTSNLGAKMSIVRTDDKRAGINLKYTHHSCAFNPDFRAYDAAGLELTYKMW